MSLWQLEALGVFAIVGAIVGWTYYLESRVRVLEARFVIEQQKEIDASIRERVINLSDAERADLLESELPTKPQS